MQMNTLTSNHAESACAELDCFREISLPHPLPSSVPGVCFLSSLKFCYQGGIDVAPTRSLPLFARIKKHLGEHLRCALRLVPNRGTPCSGLRQAMFGRQARFVTRRHLKCATNVALDWHETGIVSDVSDS